MAKGAKMLGMRASYLAGAAACSALLLGAGDAMAQGLAHRFAFRGEGAVGSMVSSHQQDNLGFGMGFEGTVRVGFNLIEPLSINLSLSNWFFPTDTGTGRVLGVLGGLRFEPKIGTLGRLFVEGNFGYAFTGDKGRLHLDAGLGFEFQVAPAFAIGPVVRYGHVIQRNDYNLTDEIFQQNFEGDAQWISGGVALTVRIPEAEAPAAPADGDGDGVADPDDQCPTTPQGSNPDPARRGCPLTDSDGDAVYDNEDQCVNVPAGQRPDPARRGCPTSDQDNDGVADGEDQCPTTAQGSNPDPARRGCPLVDTDNDTVYDNEDQCVSEPQGAHPDPARRGCPIGDRDHDGITDDVDRCQDQPETFNGRDDTDGCPDGDALGVREGGQIRIMEQVRFRNNSAAIQGRRSFAVLDAVVAIMRASPDITSLDVQGHTDDRGSAERNTALSGERAAAVALYLTQHGIEAGRIASHGFGPSRPLVQGTSRRARAANRRVEFHINGQ
jgi:outer membrane protein OmpA-like peptidoglycan-associated protein